jgi:hypothetical protein
MTKDGMGCHLSTLDDPVTSALHLVEWNSIYQVINVTGAFFTKLSIGIFLLRLQNNQKFRLTIWIFLLPLAITTLAVVLVVLLQCIPLEALWNPSVNGHCISPEIPLDVSYAQSAFAILSDLFLTLSPVAILWKIKISLGRKIAICSLMSLGLMATIANALRNAFIPNLSESDITCEVF